MSDNLMAKVAGDLRAIVELHEKLLTQAVHSANDPLMPGGLAMVELGYVASPAQWQWQIDEHERLASESEDTFVRDAQPDLSHEDDLWEPPLQTLLFWSEDWRNTRGYPLEGRRPTIATEANFLRGSLDWAWDEEVHFEEFVRDVETARKRIEDTLREGERTLRGVPCMYDECKGKRLERKMRPLYHDGERVRDGKGNGLWEFEDWRCKRCRRTWNEDEYARMVTAASERTKFEDIDGETWCSADYAARKVERSVKTIRTWINREELATLCLIAGRRLPYVSLEDVRELSEVRKTRTRSNDVA